MHISGGVSLMKTTALPNPLFSSITFMYYGQCCLLSIYPTVSSMRTEAFPSSFTVVPSAPTTVPSTQQKLSEQLY